MLVRHDAVNDAAREISFSKRGALSARLFGCRFSRRVREKFENRIARLQTQNLHSHRTHVLHLLAARTDQQAASPHAGEKSSVVMVMRKWT